MNNSVVMVVVLLVFIGLGVAQCAYDNYTKYQLIEAAKEVQNGKK